MGKSKIVFGGETLIDLTGDSVTPQTLLAGETAHNAAGEPIEGAMVIAPIDDVPTEGSENAVSSGGVWSALQEVKTRRVSVTLSASGWTAGTGYAYEQTATVSGVTASTDFDVDAALSGTDAEADELVLAAFRLIIDAESVSGGVKFRCPGEAPDANVPLTLRIYG